MTAHEPAHLLHIFPSFEVGGIQDRTTAIINRLGPRFRHSIVALNGIYTCARRLAADAPVDLLSNVTAPASVPRSLICAARTIADTRPDTLLTYNWASLDWALANALGPGCRHIHHEDGFNADEAERQLARRIAYRRVSLWRNDLLVVPSHNLYEIARRVWKRPEAKIRLIANGIDWRAFAPPDPAAALPEADRSVVLGTVAPLRAEKNVDALLRGVAKLRGSHAIELVVVGDGPERDHLETLSSALGLTDICRFQGLRHDVAPALAPIDIFMMPSLTEQMPISLLQAMAAAKPVVAYDVGDIAQMVAAENAPFIVARNDEDALTHGTARLIADPSLRRRIGAANLDRVKGHYSATAMVQNYATAYSDVLARRR